MMTSDLSQIRVVTKNELIKCVRGKKFLISVGIIVVVFLLITFLQLIINNWDSMNNMGRFAQVYLDNLPIVLALVVALISSVALVSEFEERTALILFTRPIKRTSIMVGKIISCLIIEAAIILLYYLLAGTLGFAKIGSMSSQIVTSYLVAVMFAFAASGIAFTISSFFKKGSVCTIITVLLLVVILPISSAMMGSNGGDNWFMMDKAGNTIYTCIPEYVDSYNEMAEGFKEVVQNAIDILSGFSDKKVSEAASLIDAYILTPEFSELTPDQQESLIYVDAYLHIGTSEDMKGMISVLKAMLKSSIVSTMDYPDIGRSAIVLLIWGIVGYTLAWFRFVRREF